MLNELILFITETCAIAYLIGYLFKHKKVPFFAYLVLLGIVCFQLGHVSNLTQLLLTGYIPKSVRVGLLGPLGGYAFLFSSIYSQIDSLIDGGEEEYRKHRFIALIAAIFVLSFYVPVLFSPVLPGVKVLYGISSLLIAGTAYYNFKQLIIPDVELGIVRALRGYNVSVLLLSISLSSKTICDCYGLTAGSLACTVLCALCVVLLIQNLMGGMKKWQI